MPTFYLLNGSILGRLPDGEEHAVHKIILDTDIEDALALPYALMCGEIELLGVTTVFRDTVR